MVYNFNRKLLLRSLLGITKPAEVLPSPYGNKGEGKVVPVLFLTGHHAMRAYCGSGGIDPLIL
jgi:hypothetical protein